MKKLECRFGFKVPLRFQRRSPRRLLEFRVRLHSQRFDRNDLFRPAVLDVFELFASAKVRFRSRLCIIGRLGQQRDVVLLDEAEPHSVAVQPTLLAQGDSGACGASEVTLIAERSMEPLWSPAVATSGKRWQMRRRRKPRKQAKSEDRVRGRPRRLLSLFLRPRLSRTSSRPFMLAYHAPSADVVMTTFPRVCPSSR
jgi:hypothetical protein